MRAHTLVGERCFVFRVCKYAWFNSGLAVKSRNPDTWLYYQVARENWHWKIEIRCFPYPNV